jgi:pimeloyl-ACP methyl ester carboxylesterase
VPVLLLTADRDRITVPQASEEIRRKIDGAELATLAPSGHVSVFERHEAFADAVRSFVMARSEAGRGEQVASPAG